MEELAIEEWKDVKGYEGFYLISNYGRVMSLRRKRCNGAESYYYQETRILKQSMSTTGYKKVDFKKDGKRESVKIHRLVAKHFVANPYDKNTVNHIDGDPLNNYYKNLEWTNQGENIIHSYESGLTPSFSLDKRSLYYLYINRNMSIREIGEMFGISSGPVQNLLDSYCIEKENPSKYRITTEWLSKELKSGRSNKDIAKEIGCDPSLISIYKKRIETEGEIYG